MSSCPEPHPRARRGTRPLDLSATAVAEVHRFVARRVSNLDDAADIAQQNAAPGVRQAQHLPRRERLGLAVHDRAPSDRRSLPDTQPVPLSGGRGARGHGTGAADRARRGLGGLPAPRAAQLLGELHQPPAPPGGAGGGAAGGRLRPPRQGLGGGAGHEPALIQAAAARGSGTSARDRRRELRPGDQREREAPLLTAHAPCRARPRPPRVRAAGDTCQARQGPRPVSGLIASPALVWACWCHSVVSVAIVWWRSFVSSYRLHPSSRRLSGLPKDSTRRARAALSPETQRIRKG